MRSKSGHATAAGILAGLLAFVAPPVVAATQAGVTIKGEIVFTTQDQKIIREYFRGGQGGLPPGLAKRGGKLPPGLRRHIEKNGTLPPGLQKKIEAFPVVLERRLSPLPSGVIRVSIGTDVIILDRTTNKILDIVRDVVRLERDIAK